MRSGPRGWKLKASGFCGSGIQEVLQDTVAVKEMIRAALDDGHSPPSSILPRKGGGGSKNNNLHVRAVRGGS